jgi:hypothetical protein
MLTETWPLESRCACRDERLRRQLEKEAKGRSQGRRRGGPDVFGVHRARPSPSLHSNNVTYRQSVHH